MSVCMLWACISHSMHVGVQGQLRGIISSRCPGPGDGAQAVRLGREGLQLLSHGTASSYLPLPQPILTPFAFAASKGRDTEAQDRILRILDQQRAATPSPHSIKVKDTESQKTNEPGHLSRIGLSPLSPAGAEFLLPGPETSRWS